MKKKDGAWERGLWVHCAMLVGGFTREVFSLVALSRESDESVAPHMRVACAPQKKKKGKEEHASKKELALWRGGDGTHTQRMHEGCSLPLLAFVHAYITSSLLVKCSLRRAHAHEEQMTDMHATWACMYLMAHVTCMRGGKVHSFLLCNLGVEDACCALRTRAKWS